MVTFNEDKQEQKLKLLREQEEVEVVKMLGAKYKLTYVDLSTLSIQTDALKLFAETTAREARVAAFNLKSKHVDVALRFPEDEKTHVALKSLEKRGYTITLHITTTKALVFAWERYTDITHTTTSTRGLFDISSEEMRDFIDNTQSLADVQSYIDNILHKKKGRHTSQVVEIFLAGALALRVSDIHIEPEKERVRLRYRLDGVLLDVTFFDHNTYRLFLSRIKLLSGLLLNITKEPQDGRFSIAVDENDIEIRTSILPGEYGESIVMRVLNPDALRVNVTELGMSPELLTVVEREISRPNGLVLTTGPTGSGKTTTLYSFLRKLHRPEIKIITIEDPIEYHMPGIVQTQVDRKKDYTFSSGLRSALRQDPDIIMVGEIRDRETAEIAVHASLTGHTVFSTLHTNDAAGTFPRLVDIGMNPSIIASAINMTMAQRLVRKLCEHCKHTTPLEGADRDLVKKILETIQDPAKKVGLTTTDIWVARGCDQCDSSGYKGRVGLYEAIIVDKEMKNLIEINASERGIVAAATKNGLLTMEQDGVLKALNGITSLDEVRRVINISV